MLQQKNLEAILRLSGIVLEGSGRASLGPSKSTTRDPRTSRYSKQRYYIILYYIILYDITYYIKLHDIILHYIILY